MGTEQKVDVDSVIITRDLERRPSRAPDYLAENRALTTLADALSTSPETVLQRVVELIMDLTQSGSAGISLLEPTEKSSEFRWVATAGAWSHYRDGTMPGDASPCGEVITRGAVVLMRNPERLFPALLQAEPAISEALLAPFYIGGEPVGTLWTINHNADDHFENEDARLVESLARFASAAHQVVQALHSAHQNQLASNTRLHALTQASADAFYVMSPDMLELRALTGGNFIADTKQPTHAWLEDYIPSEDHASTLAAIGEAVRTKGDFNHEHRVRQIDGEVGWVVTRAVPILDPAGNIAEWFGAAQNITATKQALAALRDDEDQQAFLLRLSDALRAEPSAETITDLALRMLSDQLRLDRCYVGVYRLAEDIGDFPHQVYREDLAPLPGQVRLSDFPDALQVAFDQTLVINDVRELQGISDTDQRSFDGLGLRALIAATLRKGANAPLWAIVAVSTQSRVWTRSEVSLVEEVAERTWVAAERARVESALRESEARFASFAASSTDVLWIRSAETMDMVYLSPAFATVYGLAPEHAMGALKNWGTLIVPEDRDVAWAHLARARGGEASVHEFRIRRPSDGTFRWIRDHGFPLSDENSVKWVGGIGTDVTETKLLVEHQSILLAELQHRVRNIMAMLRSVAERTAVTADSVAAYEGLIIGRLMAMARTQALLTRGVDAGIEIGSIVREELEAQADHKSQYVLSGPEVTISPKAAEILSLAIHELATNALKYGALSVSEGTIEVVWQLQGADGSPRLRLDWTERRPVLADWSPPTRKGFGSQLVEHRVPYELRGRGEIIIRPEGARAFIEFPLQPGTSVLETTAPPPSGVFGGALDMTGEPSLAGQIVLVLEDDFYLAHDTVAALSAAGAQVIGPFATIADALEVVKTQRITAAVIDVNLGAGPSFEMAYALREAGAPFLFLTGYDKNAIPSEFTDVVRLEKPIGPRYIIGAVAGLARDSIAIPNIKKG